MTVSNAPTPAGTAPKDPGAAIGGSTAGGGRLSQVVRWGVLAAAAAVGLALSLLLGDFSVLSWVVLSALVYVVAIYSVSRAVEGPRHALDRLVTGVVTTFFLLALIPLVSLLVTVLQRGTRRLDTEFFTVSMRGVVGEGGGIAHALQGTLMITLVTTLVAVPIGILAAIYLVEYGQGRRLARSITFFVDVMTGIPSIVAGLFAFSLFSLVVEPGFKAGIVGVSALTLLMIPVVVRSTEEMLRLVPNELREASYALGVPKWLTVVKVVLPTAVAGIATGVTLAIARIIGETAPLLVTAGIGTSLNPNLFKDPMPTLPVFAYYQITQPGVQREAYIDRAWSAILVLIVIVMALNVVARLISKFFAPKTGR
ncbi:phosphate ABC transporter permease PstA [Janibacter melonis]|uniref:phosphate ABC transporter permease PstA n=1 Tax=Janibacter melonis TaxID=262209 RepID=UPI00191B29ED|nr:phosphate ABC transporter permease PstA [Janibacter melonis]